MLVCTFLGILFMSIPKNVPTCYSILTNGERFKYVYFIKNQLLQQGVSESDIYIMHDQSSKHNLYVPPEFVLEHNYKSVMSHDGLTDLYKKFFEWIFVDNKCKYSVILEDDIFLGEDAINYFNWGRYLMEMDEDVLSVSGSHDNAADDLKLNPQVFVKAEQLLGLGWLTSSKFYEDYFSKLNVHSKTPWDKQLNDLMNKNHLVSVFPHLPRTLHVPWVSGRNGDLLKLQLSTSSRYSYYYVPLDVFMDYDRYIEWLKTHFKVKEKHGRANNVKYPYSFLAKRPFGQYKGVSIFPTDTGEIHLFRQ